MSTRVFPHNEIRVTTNGELGNYVRYALKCLRDDHRFLVLKGTGTATSKVLQLTEILKRRVGNLYQSSSIYSIVVDDIRQANRSEDGKRRISVFEAKLSFDPLDSSAIGYQDPTPPEPTQQPRRYPQRGFGYGQGWGSQRGFRGDNFGRPFNSKFPLTNVDGFQPRSRGFGRRGFFRGSRSNFGPMQNHYGWRGQSQRFESRSQGPQQR